MCCALANPLSSQFWTEVGMDGKITVMIDSILEEPSPQRRLIGGIIPGAGFNQALEEFGGRS
jgi:hypothetical protein